MFQAIAPDWEGLLRNRAEPHGRLAMLQTWENLVFLHARVPLKTLRPMIPAELEIESFDDSGWVGFVPFRISGIRKPATPTIPWVGSFYETNVRTYVTHPTYGPGVWFFSLDAARYLPCWFARRFFRLPYFHARLTGTSEPNKCRYEGRRFARQFLPAVGGDLAQLSDYSLTANRAGDWHRASPESFEFWLVERYRLYSASAGGNLLTARVAHEPYEIATASLLNHSISGLDAQFGDLTFENVLLAKTVNVRCFSPVSVSSPLAHPF